MAHYLERLQAIQGQAQATGELSYHHALYELLTALAQPQGATLLHEPRKTVAGRPDFILLRNGMPIGYLEAEAFGADLDALQGHAHQQIRAFIQNLDNFVLTNFLEFRLYRDGELQARAMLPAPPARETVCLFPDAVQALKSLLEAFLQGEPPAIADPQTLAHYLARRTRQLTAALETLLAQKAETDLHSLYRAFERTLLPDLKPEEFADLYAQTVAYGLFAARCAQTDGNAFSRQSAAMLIPPTNPFLRRLFQLLAAHDLPPTIAWVADEIATLLARADMLAILENFGQRTGKEDPIVHFYEDFLAIYDPEQREIRGVYYTPEPVVQFIVRAVDDALRLFFGKSHGLADDETLILDPACGTGSFLYEVVQQVHRRVVERSGGGVWRDYARERLIHRLFGFELLMAPYAIAHLKLGLQLQQLGVQLNSQRLGIYLTNTLEQAVKQSELLFGEFITREANAAVAIKREKPILVVLGNPPYSGHSANRSYSEYEERDEQGRIRKRREPTWIGKLIEDYKQINGQLLGERNPKWLQDDYVKFIRFAEWRIQQTGEGIVALITNHAYLDNPTFRAMRHHLLQSFQRLYIVNLHGNARRKERAPDGSPDENVFDIQQGVAILIAIRRADAEPGVFYVDVWGRRAEKYAFLQEQTLERAAWTRLEPSEPLYLFVPQDTALEAEYQQGWRIPDIFPVHSVGIVTARDKLTIHRTREAVWQTVCEFVKYEAEQARYLFKLGKDVRDWSVARAQQDLRDAGVPDENAKAHIILILYRPFDVRYTFYTGRDCGFHCRPRYKVMKELLAGDNLALITVRQQSRMQDPWANAFVAQTPVESCALSNYTREIGYVFPLYITPTNNHRNNNHKNNRDQNALDGLEGREPNLNREFWNALTQRIGEKPTPEAILGYIYAVLNSPTYRARYAEFLRRDFPRVPLPRDKEQFEQLARLGQQLIELHTLHRPGLHEVNCRCPVDGSHVVQKVRYDEASQQLYINAEQFFAPVPPEVWAFRVGGYAVCEKWLTERRGQKLSLDERLDFLRIITAIAETLRLQAEIDSWLE